MTKEKKGTNVVVFTEFQKNMAILKGKYKELPDVKTKAGYAIVIDNLKEYRAIKKRVEDARKEVNADLIKRKKGIDDEAKSIMKTIEDIFKPHKEAKVEEDSRVAEEKRLKEEADAKYFADMKAKLDAIKQSYIDAVSMCSDDISKEIDLLENLDVSDPAFGDYSVEVTAIKSAILDKLNDLHEGKSQQEENEVKLKKAQAELKEREEKQNAADKERREKQEAEDKERTEAMAKENAEMKAKMAKMEAKEKEQEAKQKKIDEDAEKVRIEQIKQDNARILEARRKVEAEAEAKRDKEAAEAKAKEEDDAKKAKEKAEKLAKKEATARRKELSIKLSDHLTTGTDAFIESIENNEIPYVSIDWAVK